MCHFVTLITSQPSQKAFPPDQGLRICSLGKSFSLPRQSRGTCRNSYMYMYMYSYMYERDKRYEKQHPSLS